MNILIVGIDPLGDVPAQLMKIANANKLSVIAVGREYRTAQQFDGTAEMGHSTIDGETQLIFDLTKHIPDKTEEKETPEIKHDYKSVKERNKFFEKRKR